MKIQHAYTSIAALCLATTLSYANSKPVTVSGKVVSARKTALPNRARLEIRIEDVSLADAPSKLFASKTMKVGGKKLPLTYSLPIDTSKFAYPSRYAIRAEIRVGKKLLLTTTTMHHVAISPKNQKIDISVDEIVRSSKK